MVGLDIAFTTAKSALSARQKEMAVISNNIAMADEENYHRQGVSLTNSAVVEDEAGYFGTGVTVQSVIRQYDVQLENNYQQSISSNSYNEKYASKLSQVEDLIGPGGDNPLTDAIQEFANNVQNVATSPEASSDRTALINSANTLASTMNQDYESLRKLRDAIASNDTTGDGAISDDIDKVNELLDDIATLNDNISRMESNLFLDQTANDLRDQRDAAVKELAEYIDITVTETSSYRYKIDLNLDSGATSTLLPGAAENETPDYLVLSMTGPTGTNYVPTIELTSNPGTAVTLAGDSGEIRALLDARTYITTQMSNLQSYAEEIRDEVNAVLTAGFDLNGNAGVAMFTVTPVTPPPVSNVSALGMACAITDPATIAASDNALQQGNGDNALALWQKLNENSVVNIGTVSDSIIGYSNAYLREISEDVSLAESNAETSSLAEEMFRNAVQERSGVSIDEEMTNMLEIQRAYQATGKLIQALQEMFDTVMSIG
jgi:flagellar hook-associated protein 1 FlgK